MKFLIFRVICSSFLVMMEFSGGCVYLIFIAENIKEVCDHLFSPAPLKFYLICLLGPLTLLCWIKNLKNLAPGATLGTSCATVCIGAVYFFIFSEPISLEGRKATGSLKSFALFFGTSMFALAAFAELMPIKNRMTKPANFTSVCGVVNVAMVPITLLYLTMGIFGYLAYGANTQNPITLNLPQTGIIGDLICGLLAGSVFLSFPIGFYVVVEELWHKNLKLKFGRSKYLDQWEYGIRTVLTFTTVLCCIAIPNLELFMALVGSLMMPAVGLWFPAIMHILTFWNEYTGFKRVLLIFKISILIFTGVFALVVSVSVTLLEIYETVL
ncbi:unnamed protein product [Bemisia tabaci]|uniref:Amino acid transporter transmembrane domain-containing protein n=2 Tax=Bemisia tabaci TaxID=7038 RepID=A0A9P0AFN8_BEMTA|nr:unnamed protein product [Bemisia tabaci]